MRRRDSRALITAAARAEFAEHGFAGARVDRVARHAGVNKQLIFYYFRSKAGLYQMVLRGAAGELGGVPHLSLPDARHAVERLRRAIGAMFEALAGRPDLLRLIVSDAHDAQRDMELARPAFERLTRDVRGVVSEGQGLGYFRDDANPDQVARQAVVLSLGYLALERALGAGQPAAERAAWREGISEILTRSLAW